MNDWADEEAAELLTHMVLEPNKFLESAAPILRAAFLRGLREAAEICTTSDKYCRVLFDSHPNEYDRGQSDSAAVCAVNIRAAADKLEKGEA